MNRNYLKGLAGGRINALLAGVGANLRKLLAAFWRAQMKWDRLETRYRASACQSIYCKTKLPPKTHFIRDD